MRDLELRVQDIEDPVVRENFDKLQRLSDDNLFGKFKGKHFSVVLTKNMTYSFKHNLGFAPQDVIPTSILTGGSATLVWNYSLFDRTNISLTVAGLAGVETLTVRAFIGSYREQ